MSTFIPHTVSHYIFVLPIRDLLWLGNDLDTKANVLIRVVEGTDSSPTLTEVQSELGILKQLTHPLFAKFREVIEEPSFLYVISDPPRPCSLRAYMAQHVRVSESVARSFLVAMADVSRHYREITTAPFVVTADSIYVDDGCNITQIYTAFQAPVNDWAYQAPELLSKRPAGAETAIWCTGVFIYYLTVGRLPFDGGSRAEVERSVLHSALIVPPAVSPALSALLAGMLRKNAFARITPEQIGRQPWLATVSERERSVFFPTGNRKPSSRKSLDRPRHISSTISPASRAVRLMRRRPLMIGIRSSASGDLSVIKHIGDA
jgi:serine/threonine protein kinase